MREPLHWASIGELGRAFRRGDLSPSAYLAHQLARIDRIDPGLHSIIHLDRAGAIAAAQAADRRLAQGRGLGPLDGIPVGIKDMIDVAGMPTTCHSALRLGQVATQDADVVAHLRRAGAIILGKLATHEFAIGGPAFDLPFPPARNPWNLAHHPGGSSSGAGAGVAAGLFPAAVGTDTAGSVRNPASACGVVGIKPTYDLVSRRGVVPLAWSLDHVGPIARCVGDAALLLDAMGAPRETPFGAGIGQGVQGMRIGVVGHFHTEDMIADPATYDAIDRVAQGLRESGAQVEPVRLPALGLFNAVNRVLLQAEGYAVHGEEMAAHPDMFSVLTRKALLPGAFLGAGDLVAAMRHRHALIEAVEAVFETVDVLLCASSMMPACAIEDPAEVARTYMLQARAPFNVTGHPALALMAGLSPGGLPIGVQLAARMGDEQTLFQVAAQWETMAGTCHPPV